MLAGARLLTALLAALCFLHTGRLMAAGAGLFLLSALPDRADGELARRSRRFSRIGRHLDLAADCIAAMSIFIGLGIGIGSGLPLLPRAYLGLGLSGAFSVAAILLLLPPVMWCGGAGWIVLASGIVTPLVALVIGAVDAHRSRSCRDAAGFGRASRRRPGSCRPVAAALIRRLMRHRS